MPELKISYVQLYDSYLDAIEPLGDAERGRLLTAILQYRRTGAAQELSGNERFIFPMMKSQLDRDNEMYIDKCKANSEKGKKGGRPASNGLNKKAKKATAFLESQRSQGEGEEKRKKEKPLPAGAGGSEVLFVNFWSSYPRKLAKADAMKAWKTLKPSPELAETMMQALEYDKVSQQWQKDDGRFIPYPATWLRRKRWEDEDQDTANQPIPTEERENF